MTPGTFSAQRSKWVAPQTLTRSADGRRRLRSDGLPMPPSPRVQTAHCRWCSAPLWQSIDVAEDDRWYDHRHRAGPCTGDSPTGDHEGPQ